MVTRPSESEMMKLLPCPFCGNSETRRALSAAKPAKGDETDETIARRLATIMHGDDVEWKGFITKAHHWMALSLASADRGTAA